MRIHLRLTVVAAALAVSTLGIAAQQTDPSSPASPRPRPTPDSTRPGTTASSPSQRRGNRSDASSRATLSSGDTKFVKEAAEGGMAEVELGRLAATHATSDQVKQFGQRMVDDHGKANNQLMELAQRHNITVPTILTGKHKSEYDRLSKLSGDQFDREYVKLMVAD